MGVQEVGVSSELGIYSVEEQMPQFPGGSRALLDFIAANMRYPDLAMEYGARGRVISTFLVDSLGNVKDIKVVSVEDVEGVAAGVDFCFSAVDMS